MVATRRTALNRTPLLAAALLAVLPALAAAQTPAPAPSPPPASTTPPTRSTPSESPAPPAKPTLPTVEDRFRRLDKNKDGELTPDEVERPRVFKALDADGDGVVTLDEARRAMKRWQARRALRGAPRRRGRGRGRGPKVAMRVTRDVRYAEIEGVDPRLLSLDVYAPPDGEKHPVLVMVHGGGWRGGDKANDAVVRPKGPFFVSNGWVFVSVNYRLAPAVHHPKQVEDIARALAYIHEHIAEHGGDPGKITLMGHSAGAHLAALVATDRRRLEAVGASLSILRGVVLLDGAAYNLPADLAAGDLEPRVARMFRMAFGADPKGWADASPITHVAAGKGIPPFLLFHAGERERSRLRAVELAGALRKAGVRAELAHAPEKDHGAMNRDIGVFGDAATMTVFTFLDHAVRGWPEAPSVTVPAPSAEPSTTPREGADGRRGEAPGLF